MAVNQIIMMVVTAGQLVRIDLIIRGLSPLIWSNKAFYFHLKKISFFTIQIMANFLAIALSSTLTDRPLMKKVTEATGDQALISQLVLEHM